MNQNYVVAPGTTKSSHQFGRELRHQLTFLSQYPHEVCRRAAPGTLLEKFRQYLGTRKRTTGEFRLILFKPLRNTKGHNHHWIIIDDGYYADFFEEQLRLYEGAYRPLSYDFLSQFCVFAEEDRQEWLENFHVHFASKNQIGADLNFWREFVIARHSASPTASPRGYGFIRRCQALLLEIQDEEYPKVGYVPVDPRELYVQYQLTPGK